MAPKSLNTSTFLDRIGISVRAMNICEALECETVGELANLFQIKGADFVIGKRNCGKKTLLELSAVVDAYMDGPRDPQFGFIDACDTHQHTFKDALNSEVLGFTAEQLLEAIERLKLPFGLPIELIRLPIRIRNWCNSHEWNTLGLLLQNAGGMSPRDFLALDNIGKKSVAEVLGFFDALRTARFADLRKFLPLTPNSIFLSLSEALNDLVAFLDTRDLQMLEMRLIEGSSLEIVGRNFKHTRELVRQVEESFLSDLKRILDWFSNERVELWKAWEITDDLTTLLSEKGVLLGPPLVAAAVATVFTNTPEGKLLDTHWADIFRNWGRELLASESHLSDGVNLTEFAKFRGRPDLVCRFQAWLEKHFGDGLTVIERRATRTHQDLTAEQRTLLFGGESNELRWRSLYERLKRYHSEYGDADVPSKWKADPQLGSWVGAQRDRRKRGVISDEEFALLDELGLTWQSRDVGTWEDRLAEVTAYKTKHGHCEIPTLFPENPKLGRFVGAMRTQRNRGALSVERIAKLDAIGFVWAPTRKAAVKLGDQMVSVAWQTQFDELVAYKEAHGDCDVPAKWEENKRLGNWVSMQRHMKKRNTLPEACIKHLEEVGFNWRADHSQQSWNFRYAELLKFKETNGHCDVPLRNPGDPSLGTWVANQRRNRNRGKLSVEQMRLLDEVGFKWKLRDATL